MISPEHPKDLFKKQGAEKGRTVKHGAVSYTHLIAYYSPDLLGMQEVLHNQMEDLKRGLPQYTALGVGRDDGKEAGEYLSLIHI